MYAVIFRIKNKLMLICHPLFKTANPVEDPEVTGILW